MAHPWLPAALLVSLFLAEGLAQQASSPFWQDVPESSMLVGPRRPSTAAAAPPAAQRLRTATPERYRTVELNPPAMAAALAAALPEIVPSGPRTLTVRADAEIQLPLPRGGFERFHVLKSPVMNPVLAARFPQIQSYVLRGIDDPSASGRLSSSPTGLKATVLSSRGTFYVRPYWRGDPTFSIVYDPSDLNPGKYGRSWSCGTRDTIPGLSLENPSASAGSSLAPRTSAMVTTTASRQWGTHLRKYRLAMACNGEFANQVCPPLEVNVANTLAFIHDSVNTIGAIFERDLAIRFELVTGSSTNPTALIYTDPATDPYPPYRSFNDAKTLAEENQRNIDAVVGSANYEFGHIYTADTATSGISYGSGLGPTFGIIGDNRRKAMCITTRGSGDHTVIDFDLVAAHEMGHGSGANHVFSFRSEVTGTQVEPGSGNTIMSYAGIVPGFDLQALMGDYFNVKSLEQIIAYTSVPPASRVGELIDNTNQPPVVAIPTNRVIPAQTPFVLEASATDADGDTLTYAWEQQDSGAKNPTLNPRDNGFAPLFRSYLPTNSPVRVFPRLDYILHHANVPPAGGGRGPTNFASGEFLPTTTRTMKFRITARDGNGGVAYQNCTVQSLATAGPFLITNFNQATALTVGSTQSIGWSFRNTTNLPIRCTNVQVSYSTNGGTNFQVIMTSNAPNNGAYSFVVPDLDETVRVRFKVEAVGNIFFDVNDADLTIRPALSSTPFDFFGSADPHGISNSLVAITNNSAGATVETGEPAYLTNPAASVWFRFTPTHNGQLQLSTEGSGFDTTLSAYRANTNSGITFTNLIRVAANDNAGTGTNQRHSLLRFSVRSNEIFYVSLDGVRGATGPYVLTATPFLQTNPALALPAGANDFLADAASMGTSSFLVTGTLLGATAQSGENALAGLRPTRSVWFRWTAPASGRLTLSTEFSAGDTVLGAYLGSGPNPSGYRLVAANDNVSSQTPWSRISFLVQPGTTYTIKVDGRSDATYQLSGSFEPMLPLVAPTVLSFSLAPTTNASYFRPVVDWDDLPQATAYEVNLFRQYPSQKIQRIAGTRTTNSEWTNAPRVAQTGSLIKYGIQVRAISNNVLGPWTPVLLAP